MNIKLKFFDLSVSFGKSALMIRMVIPVFNKKVLKSRGAIGLFVLSQYCDFWEESRATANLRGVICGTVSFVSVGAHREIRLNKMSEKPERLIVVHWQVRRTKVFQISSKTITWPWTNDGFG